MVPSRSLSLSKGRRGIVETSKRPRFDRSTKWHFAPPAQADFMAGMSLLSGLAYPRETISDIISKEGIMDLIRESSFAQYLTRQGIEQGLRESILAILEVRFGIPASHPFAERIANVDDS